MFKLIKLLIASSSIKIFAGAKSTFLKSLMEINNFNLLEKLNVFRIYKIEIKIMKICKK